MKFYKSHPDQLLANIDRVVPATESDVLREAQRILEANHGLIAEWVSLPPDDDTLEMIWIADRLEQND